MVLNYIYNFKHQLFILCLYIKNSSGYQFPCEIDLKQTPKASFESKHILSFRILNDIIKLFCKNFSGISEDEYLKGNNVIRK